MPLQRPDILIIGAGVLGSSVAWHLAQRKAGEITVIDLDLAGTYSSSELNAGGCRATWWNPINVQLSWESMKFFKTVAKEMQFFQKGYLFLYNSTRWKIALEKKSLYEKLNVPVHYLEVGDLKKFVPEFENLKGVSGATHSREDGLIDPHLVRDYYRQEAKILGVHFLDHFFVQGVYESHGEIREVDTLHWKHSISLSEEKIKEILTHHQISEPQAWEGEVFHPKILINCTGAWLSITSKLYKAPSPVLPVRRQISLFSSHDEDFSDRGMIVDTSGLYFHPEGSHTGLILSGYSNRDEKPGYRFDYDGDPFFDRKIWLRLYRRGGRRHFEAIKHVRGWAGLYEVSPDKTAILWQVDGFKNLYELGAATGRGIMQSYALGRAMAELVTQGRFETLDASPLSGKRFSERKFLYENLDI